MPRATHKKSRNGCIECKRRHVKCDEQRPICSNCITSSRQCQFVGQAPASFTWTSSTTCSSTCTRRPSSAAYDLSAQDGLPVNMLHTELLHNVFLESEKWIDAREISPGISFLDILTVGQKSPYLLNMILATSALNLSITKPERRDFYRHHATQLQNHALNSFNSLSPRFSQETYVPIFLFASALGLYLLCDTLVFRAGPFESFINNFVQYLRLHQGVRMTMAEGRWDFVRESTFKPLLTLSDWLTPMKNSHGESDLGLVCNELYERIERCEGNKNRLQAYRQAIQALQTVMTVLDSTPGHLNILVAWPVMLSRDYVDMIASRQKPALVILAYYGALIHPFRADWVFQDGGQFLIESIAQYLGCTWHEWLEWPRKVMA